MHYSCTGGKYYNENETTATIQADLMVEILQVTLMTSDESQFVLHLTDSCNNLDYGNKNVSMSLKYI